MIKRYKRKWKEIHTKPKYIFLRNLYESDDTIIGRLSFALPIGWLLSTSAMLVGGIIFGTIVGNPLMHLPVLFTGAIGAVKILAVPYLASKLFLLGRTIVKSIKEINDRKNKRYEEKEIIKNRTEIKEKEAEKEKVKEITESKNDTKKYVSIRNVEESKTISYLKERYNELSKERNKLIRNNGSKDRIEELTNEMKAILYRYNSMTNREDKTNTYDGPVPKLKIK